ncbi:hypothetical protein ACF0H5_010920 [Mactra antiquata]
MFFKVTTLIFMLGLSLSHGFEDKTISQWLADNGYTTLVSLLKQAGLYSTLDSPGAYTLFAPNNQAFAGVPQSTLNQVTSDNALLESVLKYHVLSGFAMAPTFKDGASVSTLNGQNVMFRKYANGTLTVNNVKIDPSSNDIILNNGVLHVIDGVLMPNTEKIGELLLKRGDQFSTLNMLLTLTDLEPTLLQNGQFTLFAPTDDAFNKIASALPDFGSPGVVDQYANILKDHLVNGIVMSSDLKDGQTLTTLSGKRLTVNLSGGGVQITPAGTTNTGTVTEADLTTSNGVVHVIDGVLVPQM